MLERTRPPCPWRRRCPRQRDHFVPSSTPFLARFGLEALATVRVEEDTGAVPRSNTGFAAFGALRAQFQQRAVGENRPFAHSDRFPGHKGRFAVVMNVGCGMRWTRQRQKTSDVACGRRSRVVLTPRRWRQVRDDSDVGPVGSDTPCTTRAHSAPRERGGA
jgi:hypothetical protein